MSVMDDLLTKKSQERTVKLALDPELALHAAEAEQALGAARARYEAPGAGPETGSAFEQASEAFDAAVEAMRPTVATFTFQSISTERFDELKRQHRPTEAQKTEARKLGRPVPEWDEETFSPAMIAAACVKVETPNATSDGISVEDAEKLWQSPLYNKAEKADLFNTAWAAYSSKYRMVDFPKAAG